VFEGTVPNNNELKKLQVAVLGKININWNEVNVTCKRDTFETPLNWLRFEMRKTIVSIQMYLFQNVMSWHNGQGRRTHDFIFELHSWISTLTRQNLWKYTLPSMLTTLKDDVAFIILDFPQGKKKVERVQHKFGKVGFPAQKWKCNGWHGWKWKVGGGGQG